MAFTVEIGKRASHVRRNGEKVVGKIIDKYTTGRGEWATLAYQVGKGKEAVTKEVSARLSGFAPANA